LSSGLCELKVKFMVTSDTYPVKVTVNVLAIPASNFVQKQTFTSASSRHAVRRFMVTLLKATVSVNTHNLSVLHLQTYSTRATGGARMLLLLLRNRYKKMTPSSVSPPIPCLCLLKGRKTFKYCTRQCHGRCMMDGRYCSPHVAANSD